MSHDSGKSPADSYLMCQNSNKYIHMYIYKKKGIEDDYIMGDCLFFFCVSRSVLNSVTRRKKRKAKITKL